MTGADFSHVTFISAGAGSGKTYRLTEELERALIEGVPPERVIATTFTVKAAGELKDRVRERLIGSGHTQLAEQMSQALVGTVHSVCERLLKRFAFELGLSTELNVLGIEDQRLFHQALDEVVALDDVHTMNALQTRLSAPKKEWQSDVKLVADRARDNNIDAGALVAMGAQSADELLAFFPPPVVADHRSVLMRAIDDARASIDTEYDTTKGTREYLDKLDEAHRSLPQSDCAWSVWLRLSNAVATKKSESHAAIVRAAAQRYEVHPGFHADIREYIERVYVIAAAALGRFQTLKTQRGLIDFTDMEQLTLRALDNAEVVARLADELQLLLVDEFQDTNPMQLALFMKLARIATRVVFVGDVKQAIYAFRGSDPELVSAALASLAAAGADTDYLTSSWRAQRPLLGYLNAIFARAFATDGIAAGEVELTAQRTEVLDGPAVIQWRAAGNQNAQYEALARGIAKRLADGDAVVDPDSKAQRAVRFGDIAVLARTLDHVKAIARALQTARVPMKMSLDGLSAVPEVRLANACLRRLTDPSDTLATAEIVAFAGGSAHEGAAGSAPEVWLADRLRYLASEARSNEWLETTHPIVKRLAELRADVAYQSPVETVARVLNDVGIREVTAGWGPDAIKAAQRQRNLDAFLNLAVEYEAYCASQHEAATLTGFLFWAKDPHSPELDLQPTVTTGDAVHVLTYHKAKGLEWPVVICSDFDWARTSAVWGVRVNLTAPFLIDAPLEHRAVRFWPRIFAERRNIRILDEINASAAALDCERSDAAEHRRLAYVGMTRARDTLIVALPAKPLKEDAWLNTFASEELLPTGDAMRLPDGDIVTSGYAELSNDGAAPAPLPYAPRWFPQRARLIAPLREIFNPSRAAAQDGATTTEVVELGDRITVRGDDMATIGNALHRVIAMELVNPDRADALFNASAILQGFGVDAFVDAADALRCARRFREFVTARFEPRRILAEVPAAAWNDAGQLTRGWIDVLVETAAGWVVIDHKSSPRPRSEWRAEALAHSGQLASYRSMIAAAGEVFAPSTWIHFPVTGGMVRVSLADGGSEASGYVARPLVNPVAAATTEEDSP